MEQKIGYFEGWGQVQIVLGSTHIVQLFSFSLFPSILAFDFDLILGLFFTFWGPSGLFLGLGQGSITVLGSTHLVEQLPFSMFPSNLTFDRDGQQEVVSRICNVYTYFQINWV